MCIAFQFDRKNKHHYTYVEKLSKRNNFYTTAIQRFIHITPCATGILIHEKNKVCGFVFYSGMSSEKGNAIQINYLLIDKKYRNKGHGSKLIQALCSLDCLAFGVKASHNINSVVFWLKMGFWFEKSHKYPKTQEELKTQIELFQTNPES